MQALELNGTVVLITGATGGIGSEVVRALYARGARLVVTGLSRAAVDLLLADMDPRRVLGRALDVTDAAATLQVVEEAVDTFGRLDVVFANAAITSGDAVPMSSLSLDAFEKVVEVDLLGVWRTVKACLPHVRASRGHILLTSSIYAFANGVCNAPYAVSKAGVEVLGRALRAELAGTGATAGVLYPGWVATPMTAQVFEDSGVAQELLNRLLPGPLRRPIEPWLVARAVANGIESRSARIVVPRRWATLSALRGLFSMVTDALLDVDVQTHGLLRRAEQTSWRHRGNVAEAVREALWSASR